MLKIFIAHSYKDDISLVKQLQDVIKKIGDKKLEVIIAEEIPKSIKFLPDKFTDLIDECDIFLPLITDNAYKKNKIWMQQEIGYAYSCKKNTGIEIIPIVQNRAMLHEGFINIHTDIKFSLSDPEYHNWEELFEEVVKYIVYKIPESFSLELKSIQMKEIGSMEEPFYRFIIQGLIENRRRTKQLDIIFGIILWEEDNINIRVKGSNWFFNKLGSTPTKFKESINDKAIFWRAIIEKIYPFDFFPMELHIDISKSFQWERNVLPLGFYLISNGRIYLWNPVIVKDEVNFKFDNKLPPLLKLGDEILLKPIACGEFYNQ